MGMSQTEAMATAKEFENLSSDEVIGEMIKRMEESGATANQMTFALESMGNDLSKLIPLYTDNGAATDTLTTRFKTMNEQLSITK